MSDPENFLARWARRKREAAAEPKPSAAADAIAQDPLVPAKAGTQSPMVQSEQAALDPRFRGNERERSDDPVPKPGAGEPLVDLTKLPPIESITAETDLRAFLAPGVPPELTRAALRRAWSADPAIRDYVGLSENSWDFNAPDAIPGFGPLQMTDELRRQIARMVGAVSSDATDHAAARSSEASAAQTSTETSAGSVVAPAASEIQGANAPGSDQPDGTAELSDHDMLLQRKMDDAAAQTDSEKTERLESVARRSHGRALPD